MLTLAGVSASAPPFVSSGIMLVRPGSVPPVPVLVTLPPPVHLNQVSSVKVDAPSADVPAAAPNVTYWLGPFSWTPLPADTGMNVNVAVTDLFPSMVIDCGLAVPVRLPDQLPKVQPDTGFAVSCTTSPR